MFKRYLSLISLLLGIYFCISCNNNERIKGLSADGDTSNVAVATEGSKKATTEPVVSVVNIDSIVSVRVKAYQDSIDAVAAERELSVNSIYISKKVDLGLSVYWAEFNVGAFSPEGYGDYYSWGETATKSNYSQKYYQYWDGSYIDIGHSIGATQYDVAHTNWGDSWRLPTEAEFRELIDNCTWTWTTYKGINGYKVTGSNGNSIFLPAAGYFAPLLCGRGKYGSYWCEKGGSRDCCATALSFSSSDYNSLWSVGDRREWGYSIRPVCYK